MNSKSALQAYWMNAEKNGQTSSRWRKTYYVLLWGLEWSKVEKNGHSESWSRTIKAYSNTTVTVASNGLRKSDWSLVDPHQVARHCLFLGGILWFWSGGRKWTHHPTEPLGNINSFTRWWNLTVPLLSRNWLRRKMQCPSDWMNWRWIKRMRKNSKPWWVPSTNFIAPRPRLLPDISVALSTLFESDSHLVRS